MPRAPTTPYIASSDIDAFFARMPRLAPPDEVTSEWVANYGFAQQASAVVNMLKWLGIADAEGKVDAAVWNKVRVVASREEALAELIRKAYAGVFDRVDDLSAATNDDLHGAFVDAYGIGDTRRYVRSFLALCHLAGIATFATREDADGGDGSPARKTAKKAAKKAAEKAAKKAAKQVTHTPPQQQREVQAGGAAQVIVNFNVVLAADWSDDEVRQRIETVLATLNRPS